MSGLVIVVIGGILYCPPIRWPLVGLIWHEPHYRGMPLSYWRSRLIDSAEARERAKWTFGDPAIILSGVIGGGRRNPAIPEDEPAAIPILLILLEDEDPRVRAEAAFALSFRPPNDQVVPALLKAMTDRDPKVREQSIDSIGRLGPVAKDAAPSLLMALDDHDEFVRSSAGIALYAVDPKTAKKNDSLIRQRLGIPDIPGVPIPFP